MNPIAVRFGDNLRLHRKRAKLSQEELAVRASIHRTEVGLLERGERTPKIDTLIKVAGGLEVAPAELVRGIEWRPGAVSPGSFNATSPEGEG